MNYWVGKLRSCHSSLDRGDHWAASLTSIFEKSIRAYFSRQPISAQSALTRPCSSDPVKIDGLSSQIGRACTVGTDIVSQRKGLDVIVLSSNSNNLVVYFSLTGIGIHASCCTIDPGILMALRSHDLSYSLKIGTFSPIMIFFPVADSSLTSPSMSST